MDGSPPNDLKEQEEFWRGIFSEYCPKCPDICCSVEKHKITLREEDDPGIFTEHGIKSFPWEELDETSVINWHNGKIMKVETKLGLAVPVNSVIEYPLRIWLPISPKNRACGEMERAIYANNFCPLYDNPKKICLVHEDERRPYCCRHYPLVYPYERGGEPENLLLNEHCYLAQKENFGKLKKRFNQAFPKSGLDLIRHRF